MVNIGRKQVSRLVLVATSKMYDINAAGTGAHVCNIAAKVPPNTTAIIVSALRASGTGQLVIYPRNHASIYHTLNYATMPIPAVVPITNLQIKYAQTNGGDDFDLHLHSYFVEGPAEV